MEVVARSASVPAVGDDRRDGQPWPGSRWSNWRRSKNDDWRRLWVSKSNQRTSPPRVTPRLFNLPGTSNSSG